MFLYGKTKKSLALVDKEHILDLQVMLDIRIEFACAKRNKGPCSKWRRRQETARGRQRHELGPAFSSGAIFGKLHQKDRKIRLQL